MANKILKKYCLCYSERVRCSVCVKPATKASLCNHQCGVSMLQKILNKTFASLPRKKLVTRNRVFNINSPKYHNNYASLWIFSSIWALAIDKNACQGHAGRTLSDLLSKP